VMECIHSVLKTRRGHTHTGSNPVRPTTFGAVVKRQTRTVEGRMLRRPGSNPGGATILRVGKETGIRPASKAVHCAFESCPARQLFRAVAKTAKAQSCKLCIAGSIPARTSTVSARG
jgi:hypothetical protein